jgi:flagellar secretion chaperone FliS
MTDPRIAYREADVRGATAVRLVVLLYEQLIQDLSKAAQAIEQNNIELRTNCINHAILVIGYLQSPLDFANGGKVAKDLENFYNALRKNLVQVQFVPSKAGISPLIKDLLAVREAWIEVEQKEKSFVAPAAVAPSEPTISLNTASADSKPARVDWQG